MEGAVVSLVFFFVNKTKNMGFDIVSFEIFFHESHFDRYTFQVFQKYLNTFLMFIHTIFEILQLFYKTDIFSDYV